MKIESVYPRTKRVRRSSRLLFFILSVIVGGYQLMDWATKAGYTPSAYRTVFSYAKQDDPQAEYEHKAEWEEYSIKPIAYVFPQFHAIPENDRFWGVNFTEWTNVKKIKKNRFGLETLHPAKEVGYYNLLDYDVRKRYAKLVRDSGYFSFYLKLVS